MYSDICRKIPMEIAFVSTSHQEFQVGNSTQNCISSGQRNTTQITGLQKHPKNSRSELTNTLI